MKKLLLTATILLTGLSAQAGLGVDWKTEPNIETAKEAAMNCFSIMAYPHDLHETSIPASAIVTAMNKFPDFLNWRFEHNRTILHLIAINGSSEEALTYLLGFTPDLTNVQDDNGKIPQAYGATKPSTMEIFNRFKLNPWRNANHDRHDNANGLLDGQKIPSQTSIFGKKVLGMLGTMVLLGILYRYNKSRKQSAAA
jgi:hypothetical protein